MLSLIIGFVLGNLWGVKRMQKNMKKENSEKSTERKAAIWSNEYPLYEEVKLEENTATIDLSTNTAYDIVKKK